MSSCADDARSLPAPANVPAPRKVPAIAFALAVPFVASLLGLLPWRLLPHVDGHDRALVWIVGGDAALRDAAARVEAEPAFPGGATSPPAPALADPSAPSGAAATNDTPPALRVPPAPCPAHAMRLHFDVARIDEAQAAREALERIAADAGAVVCASHRFEINRADVPTATWLPLAASLLLPAAWLVAVRMLWPSPSFAAIAPWRTRDALALLAAGVAATGLLPLPHGIRLPGADAVTSVSAAMLAMALLAPAIHEAAFRGWLVPRVAGAAGRRSAAVVSLLAGTAAMLPFTDAAAATASSLAAAAGCLVFVRSGSLPACIGAHLLVAALARGLLAPLP